MNRGRHKKRGVSHHILAQVEMMIRKYPRLREEYTGLITYCKRQEEAGNRANLDKLVTNYTADDTQGGFNWSCTEEGHVYWRDFVIRVTNIIYSDISYEPLKIYFDGK